MQIKISHSSLRGEVMAPASKSSMQRALALSLIRKGTTILHNPGISNDDLSAREVIQNLGATINELPDGTLSIHSNGVSPKSLAVNCKESGLGLRMFTPIAALSNQTMVFNGTGSLLSRPMNFFDEILPQLGVEVKTNQGCLPIQIKGPLVPKNITVDGSLSSQFLTGLLMAYCAAGANGVTLSVKGLTSKPYIDLTLKLLKDFDFPVHHDHYEQFHFNGFPDTVEGVLKEYTVEADWSGAAFLLVAGVIAGPISILGLDLASTQADKAILKALQQAGAQINLDNDRIMVSPSELTAFQFDATDCPDLFPPLVSLAAFCKGTSCITGIDRLTHKESNRSISLQEEFKKLGVEIELQNNDMLVKGGVAIPSANCHSHHDHRIAMAIAVAALKSEGEVTIHQADAINKSYPNFFEHLQYLGAQITR